jgi:uncharacterized protein YqjF (DUF2071 family)
MNLPQTTKPTAGPSLAARQRLLSRRWEPLFTCAWLQVLMIHFELEAKTLQREVPFDLDLYDGRAFVSLVAFTMRDLRPKLGGHVMAWLFRPIASHQFLNVRTYVRHDGEPGIHFLAEWLSNWLAVKLGPATFGLPYRQGRIGYHHNVSTGVFHGRVSDPRGTSTLAFRAGQADPATCEPCAAGSLSEWLMERYTAFNSAGRCQRFFRVWHPPWPQCPVSVTLENTTLLAQTWFWISQAQCIGGNYSPGFDRVWMGRPHLCRDEAT